MANIGDVWMSLELKGNDLVAAAKVQGTKAGEAAGTAMSGGIRARIKGMDIFKGGIIAGAGVKLAGAAFGILDSAISGAIGKLDEAHEAFLQDQVSATQLALALENNVPAWDGSTAAVEEYATAQGRLAFSDDEVRESLGQLVGITHDQTEAMRLNSIAQDLARAKNISLAEASDIVTKAAQGNGKALKSLGIDTAGLTDAAGLLDAIQRNVAGSAEAWAQTNEGRLAVSNTKVQESMEKVGAIIDQVSQVVVPLVADAFVGLIDILGDFWDATEPIRTKLGPIISTVFGTVGDILSGVFDVIGDIIGAIQDAIQWVQDLTDMLTAPTDKVNQLRGGPTTVTGPRFQTRAVGGPAPAGVPLIVGERRPEVFVPSERGTIVPSLSAAASMLGGGQPAIIRIEAGGNALVDYIDENLYYRRR
jgi:hypothetical protein